MNDVLIAYEYNDKKKLKIKPYFVFLNEFKCIRGNYGKFSRLNISDLIWDIIIENDILNKYRLLNSSINIFNYLNDFLKSDYTNTIINNPKVYYVPINKYYVIKEQPTSQVSTNTVETQTVPESKTIDDKMELINLITTKLRSINELVRKDREV